MSRTDNTSATSTLSEIRRTASLLTSSGMFARSPSSEARDFVQQDALLHYEIGGPIGRGASGEVFDAVLHFSGGKTFHCAAKKIPMKKMGPAQFDCVENELHKRLTDSLSSSIESGLLNWVAMIEVDSPAKSNAGKSCYLFMTKCSVVLKDCIAELATLREIDHKKWSSIVFCLLKSMVNMLASLKARNAYHGDLKPQNMGLCINPEGVEKMGWAAFDFGTLVFSDEQPVDDTLARLKGTPPYIAPEVCAGVGESSINRDMWALGQILGKLLGEPVLFCAANDTACIFSAGQAYEHERRASMVRKQDVLSVQADSQAALEREIRRTTDFHTCIALLKLKMCQILPENRPTAATLEFAVRHLSRFVSSEHQRINEEYFSSESSSHVASPPRATADETDSRSCSL